MLESKKFTDQEIEQYLESLKKWLAEVSDIPTEEMAAFFTKRIAEYEAVHLKNWSNEYEHIADYFEPNLGTLLDIGCGTGLELAAIYQRFPHVKVTGIDLCETMLNELQQKFPKKEIQIIQADYFQYPLQDQSYDAVMSFETLHHFEMAKKQRIYNKIYQAIKNGGYYIECDYTACCDEEERICLEAYQDRRKRNHVQADEFVHIDIPLTLQHQIALLQHAGFQLVQVVYQNGNTIIIKAIK